MRLLTTAALVSCAFLSACSSGTSASGGADTVSAQECRQYYEYTYSLDGMDAASVLGEDQLQKDSQTCADNRSVTRRHFDCAMASDSVDALQACGAPNT